MGVVGTLQFDVLEYRLKNNEYGVDTLYMGGGPALRSTCAGSDSDDGEPVKEEDLIPWAPT